MITTINEFRKVNEAVDNTEKAKQVMAVATPEQKVVLDDFQTGTEWFFFNMLNGEITAETIDRALQLMYNSVEGDMTQLEPEHAKYVEAKGWTKEFNSLYETKINEKMSEAAAQELLNSIKLKYPAVQDTIKNCFLDIFGNTSNNEFDGFAPDYGDDECIKYLVGDNEHFSDSNIVTFSVRSNSELIQIEKLNKFKSSLSHYKLNFTSIYKNDLADNYDGLEFGVKITIEDLINWK